ncbi:MAG: GatB/YqeY domain-containing protein [Proteobacteria bacterium]|nr:GatB/YqeY domain-containing protein [Pseudomonadota bacterium]MDA1331067.1 GatB/YqeY domain-containing protein [Pseudomonadota bacterium]
MNLKSKIEQNIRSAMKARSEIQLSTLRLLMAALKQQEIDRRVDLNDGEVIAILEKMIKQRKESICIYQEANRRELADREQAELDILMTYLPQQLSVEEMSAAVGVAIVNANANGPKDMGKVMALLKSELAGKADFSVISALVKEALS